LHQTQIIVFYILLLLGFYGFLRLGRFTFWYYRQCRKRWLRTKSIYKAQITDYWQGLSLLKKCQFMLFGTLCFSGVFFLLFM
jgi:hypothetical protein